MSNICSLLRLVSFLHKEAALSAPTSGSHVDTVPAPDATEATHAENYRQYDRGESREGVGEGAVLNPEIRGGLSKLR